MDHKKKKSVGNLFGYSSERSSSSPNLKSYLKEDNNNYSNNSSSNNLNENEELSSNQQKIQSTPTSPVSINNNSNISLNSSGNSIGVSSSPSASPMMTKKKPSRLAQAFKKVKHNNKLKREIEELSNKTGLNQQYTRSNLPFNVIQGDGTLDSPTGSSGGGSGHSRQNSKVSKKHQRKSRFIEPITQSTEDYTDIPRIIKVSIEYLFEKCLKVPGLFRESANALELQRLSQIFEKGEDLDLSNYNDPHCIGGLLKLYLRERPNPIFPYDLHKSIYNVLNEEDSSNKIRELLENGLSKGQYLILRYLFELLNSVHNNSEYNRMNYQNLAICFAPSLIQSYDTSCIDVIERLIDQYEAIFSVVVVVVESNSNGGSIDLSSSPIKITETMVDNNNKSINNSYTVVLDSSEVLEQFKDSYNNSGNVRSSINSSNGIKKSPLLSSSSGIGHRKSISPKMNNRKSVNLKKISTDTLQPPSALDILDNNDIDNNGEVVTRPRKNSSVLYLSGGLSKNRPNSWSTKSRQSRNGINKSTPTKRLHSVNSIDYNKSITEPFDRSEITLGNNISSIGSKGSLNKQMVITNTNLSPSTPESDNTSIASDEDEELKISNIKPSLSRSSSISNLVDEVNKLEMDVNHTNSLSNNNDNDYSNTNSASSNNVNNSNKDNQPVLSTNYSNIEKPVYNYNRFLQPANRSVSNPNIKNFSLPSSGITVNTSIYSKRTLFSPVRKQSIVSSKKNTFSGTSSTSFNGTGSNNSGNITPTLSTQSSKSDLTSSVSSISSNISTSSSASSGSNSSSSHNKTPSSTSSTSTTTSSASASNTNSPIRKISHQHTNSLSSLPPSSNSGSASSSSSSAAASTTSSSNSSPLLQSTSNPPVIRPSLNHTVSASTLISKFNQIDNSSNNNQNWKSGIEKQKQAPVKKSVAIFEKKEKS